MSRRARFFLVLALCATGLTAGLVPMLRAHGHPAPPRLMRIGGVENPCTCTHRIEP